MPGHKRNKAFEITGAEIDITEIDGFDNLHNPKEILKELEDSIAELFGYKKSIISVNGSTCGILAAISAVSHKGDKIIIARNCHKSVYNACYINELDVIYIKPEYNEDFGCYGKVNQEKVDKAIDNNPDACAVVVTSPTYEGIISQISCDIPLIIDSAHGAHFGLTDWLPDRVNADIVVQSLHKTLPSLTQSAVVNINNPNLFGEVKKYMDIFETSSPSYILLDSIDKCVDYLKNSKNDFDNYKATLDDFHSFVDKTDGVRLLKNDDITRLILSVDGYSGSELANILRNEYDIEVEGSALNYVILISTICDTKAGFVALKYAIASIKKRNNITNTFIKTPQIPQKSCNLFEVEKTAETLIDNSIGLVSGEYIYAYPPGCPIIAPGEIISEEIVDYIKKCIENNINILSDSNLLPLKILTKAKY